MVSKRIEVVRESIIPVVVIIGVLIEDFSLPKIVDLVKFSASFLSAAYRREQGFLNFDR